MALLAIALLAAGVPAHADTAGMHRKVLLDSFAEGVSGYSELFAIPDAEASKVINNTGPVDFTKEVPCTSSTSALCSDTGMGLTGRIYLPVCSSADDAFCVQSLEVSSGTGAPLTSAQYTTDAPGGHYFTANPAKGFPGAGATSLWRSSALHAGGTGDYAVKALMDFWTTSTSSQPFVFSIQVLVQPYGVRSGQKTFPNDCNVFESATACANRTDFAPGQRIALTMHLPNSVTGWLNGRLGAPTISVSAIDAAQNQLRVEAEPLLVQDVDVELTDAQFNALPNPKFFLSGGGEWISNTSGNPASLEWVNELSGVLQNRPTGEHTAWAFSTTTSPSDQPCLQDKTRLIGIVTTNALAYNPGAPDFSGSYLDYKVAGLHYRLDGTTLNVGSYDLLMRSDVARCLYKFTSAPLSATVSVIDAGGGVQQVGTTAVSEHDGWLHLGAYGYTYSNPTLRVQLHGTTQPTPTQAAAPVKATAAKKTITCVKGKQTKKVSAANPKCPTGWKKK